jgi:rare lipoprotein A
VAAPARLVRPLRGLAWLLAAALLAGCATLSPREASLEPVPGATETGDASWYGAEHHGRATASGEPFDMNALTAAHRTLPFGTRVVVTNLANDRQVAVRINDRGPWIRGRVIDLSYAAARGLGSVSAGIVPVRIRVLSVPY